MWHLSFRRLQEWVERKFDKQKRFNQVQMTELDDLRKAGQSSLQWVKTFKVAQRKVNVERVNEIKELRDRCANLDSCVNTGIRDRTALEARVEVLEHLQGVENDEYELPTSSSDSAYKQYSDRITELELERERMKHQLQAQAGTLRALESRLNTQPAGQRAGSYQVHEDVGPARSSNKKVWPEAPHRFALAKCSS